MMSGLEYLLSRPQTNRGPDHFLAPGGWDGLLLLRQNGGSMLKKCLAALAILVLIVGAAWGDDPQYPYEKEQIGQLHLGLSAKAVKQLIPGRPTRGPEENWAIMDVYHQWWKYPEAGIALDMFSKKKGGPKYIGSMAITSPCKLKTQRGIGIGSTEAEVANAYGRFRNAELSKTFESFVAGSTCGGVLFDFQQGKVSRISVCPFP
jgi:hypothetical protein